MEFDPDTKTEVITWAIFGTSGEAAHAPSSTASLQSR